MCVCVCGDFWNLKVLGRSLNKLFRVASSVLGSDLTPWCTFCLYFSYVFLRITRFVFWGGGGGGGCCQDRTRRSVLLPAGRGSLACSRVEQRASWTSARSVNAALAIAADSQSQLPVNWHNTDAHLFTLLPNRWLISAAPPPPPTRSELPVPDSVSGQQVGLVDLVLFYVMEIISSPTVGIFEMSFNESNKVAATMGGDFRNTSLL